MSVIGKGAEIGSRSGPCDGTHLPRTELTCPSDGETASLNPMPSDPPLKGLKVVELGGLAPVPFVGYLFP
jgi:hypothetical protein